MKEQLFENAMRETRVIYAPDRRIEAFGDTMFNFRLLTESLDEPDVCHIRTGRIEALRPRILRPEHMMELALEGFGDDASALFDWMKERGASFQALIQYGFQFRRVELQEETVHEKAALLEEQLREDALHSGDPLRAVIWGVEDAWEASLLIFMLTMIQESHEINLFDMRRRGLL